MQFPRSLQRCMLHVALTQRVIISFMHIVLRLFMTNALKNAFLKFGSDHL